MATGGDRAGLEPSSRGAASPAPAPHPGPDSPACGAGLAPFGVDAALSPSPRSPNHWDPGPASGGSSSWGSGGAAIAGGPRGAATAAWRGRGAVAGRAGAPCCSPAGTRGWGGGGVSAAAAAATPAEPLPAALAASAPPPPPPSPRPRRGRPRSSSYSSGGRAAAAPLRSPALRRWKWPASAEPSRRAAAPGQLRHPAAGSCIRLPWGGIKAEDAQVGTTPAGARLPRPAVLTQSSARTAVRGTEATRKLEPSGPQC